MPSAEHAIARVTDRVRRGGHHVPDRVVRRRYHAGLRNFFRLYRPLASTWQLYDSSHHAQPRLVAIGGADATGTVLEADAWQRVKARIDHGPED